MSRWETLASSVLLAGVLLTVFGLGAVLTAPRRIGWAQAVTVAGYLAAVAGALGLLWSTHGWRGPALAAALLLAGTTAGSLTRLRK